MVRDLYLPWIARIGMGESPDDNWWLGLLHRWSSTGLPNVTEDYSAALLVEYKQVPGRRRAGVPQYQQLKKWAGVGDQLIDSLWPSSADLFVVLRQLDVKIDIPWFQSILITSLMDPKIRDFQARSVAAVQHGVGWGRRSGIASSEAIQDGVVGEDRPHVMCWHTSSCTATVYTYLI